MTLVKICGITNLEDALCAVEAGAGALGFNFYRRSPRYVEPANARRIIEQLPAFVMNIGVFVNEERDKLELVATQAGVTALQLHGDESPTYCAGFSSWYVIKAFAVNEHFDVRKPLDYDVDAVMLDASHKSLRGGTGHLTDWTVAKRVGELGMPLFLAGGLSPENVSDAITFVRPYAVDACSALEESPGKKNHQRVRSFLKAVREDLPG